MISRNLKRVIIIVLIILIAGCSTEYMLSKEGWENRITYTVFIAKEYSQQASKALDGVRDFAANNDIILDVYYEKDLSDKEIESIVSREDSNHAKGSLFIYPEEFLR